MTITNDQRQAMLEAAKPLMKWMSDNLHPHHKSIVTIGDVELVEGLAMAGTDEYTAKD